MRRSGSSIWSTASTTSCASSNAPRNTVVARVGRPGRYAGQFHVVHNIAVDAQGNVYTTEVNTGQRVQKFRRLDPQD